MAGAFSRAVPFITVQCDRKSDSAPLPGGFPFVAKCTPLFASVFLACTGTAVRVGGGYFVSGKFPIVIYNSTSDFFYLKF